MTLDLRRRWQLGVVLALLPLAARAQTATLARDIQQREADFFSGGAGPIAAVPGRAFFSAGDGELWSSDGTPAGTFPLKNGCAGPCGSGRSFGIRNGILLWAGGASANQLYLWRSDGTRPGTYRLLDEPISSHVDLGSFDRAPRSGPLYFVSSTGGLEALWRTDGTPAGTQMVRRLDPGQVVETLLVDAGKIFLIVRTGPAPGTITTWAIWTSDGTAGGTQMIADLDNTSPAAVQAAGGHLFFLVRDEVAGLEVWASDGTGPGTRAVTAFVPTDPFDGPFGSLDFSAFQVSGGRLYFQADDGVHGRELYESDGTVAGTRRISDLDIAEPFFGPVANLGRRVVFTAGSDEGHAGVWSSTGDPASSRQVVACAGEDCRQIVHGFVKVGPRVVLFVETSAGTKVLSTDGTPAGTRILRDGCPEACDLVLPQGLPAEAAAVPFGVRIFPTLWITDGTPAGTRQRAALPYGLDPGSGGFSEVSAGSFSLIAIPAARYDDLPALWALDRDSDTPRLLAAPTKKNLSSVPGDLTAFQGRLAFTACQDATFSLWRSAGSEASTVPAVELSAPDGRCQFVADGLANLGSALVFARTQDSASRSWELWRSDGTPAGTQRLTPLGIEGEGPLVAGTGRVYFTVPGVTVAGDGTTSLWTSDGRPAGTRQLASWPDHPANRLSALTVLGNELWFYLGSTDLQLWASDGTPQGTRKVFDQRGAAASDSFTRLGPLVYFVSRGTGTLEAVWQTDGTTAGTRALEAVAGMDSRPVPRELLGFQGSLYFFAWVAPGVRGFWRSDGTAAGTVLLAQFPEPGHQLFPSGHLLTAASGKLYFVAADRIGQGAELWVSDGTAAGTHLLRGVNPGLGPGELTAAGGRLFFTAAEETHGRELWVSDGTAAGTRLVQDIAPLGASSTPEQLTVAGDRLYFTADDGVSGRELWSLPLAEPGGCQPSSTRLCLNGGRYMVEASWRTSFQRGKGAAVPLTGDTGYFWFFDPANVEVVIKVLDGRGLNGHAWVFYGALSNVEYTLTVTDTETGASRRYYNPAGRLASVGDTHGFGPLGAYSVTPQTVVAPPAPLPRISERADRAAAGTCQASPRRLCLNGGRFAVEVAWRDFQGNTGVGTAVPLTGDTGTFWFFNDANVELVVKALDGRALNGKFWLFYGALSNVGYTVTVTDTETGTVRTYENPSGRFASVADTAAF
jgi:ELWxxDGT repeat protein